MEDPNTDSEGEFDEVVEGVSEGGGERSWVSVGHARKGFLFPNFSCEEEKFHKGLAVKPGQN